MAVPKLRFKEFDGDWGKTTILDISTLVTKGTTPKVFVEGRINFLKIEAINGNSFDLAKCQTISDEIHEKELKRSILQEGDILFAIAGATIGKNAIVTESILPANTNQALAIIRLDDKDGKDFVSKVLNSPFMEKYIESNISTGAQPNLNLQQIGNFAFNLPSKPEQTKIASFLSNMDEKISQLTQKHELLSQYKQGMMQKLFSQEIRFKADDGREFGEWENKTLSKFIIKHIGGASLKPSDFVEQSEYEVIPKKAIVPNGYLNLDKDNPTYCSEDFFKANLKNTVDNTYLVTVLRDLVPSGPSIGYIVKYMENTQYILAQGVYGFKLKEELNKDFLIHYSNTKAYRLVMQSIMVGSTQVHIRNQDFFGIEIPVPCLAEQTKIANFLSAIDQKIEVVAQQIEQAKQWKKGLLQQMFV